MLTSMTGFSRVSVDKDWGSLTVEFSSVNSRYLEVFVKSGRELASEDPLIQGAVKKRLNRGKVQVRVELSWASECRMGRINPDVLSSYLSQVKDVVLSMGDGSDELPLNGILGLPGVLDLPSASSSSMKDEISSVLADLTSRGLDELVSMRESEGEKLLEDISGCLEDYRVIVSKIGSLWRGCADKAFESLKERVQAVADRFEISMDEGRLAQEMTVIADKWDISEELSRTDSHIGQFEKLLDEEGPRGRKLDFLLQEMNREINTMGSKVADAEIRWLVVDGKSLLERIREQVQNVE